MAISLPAVQYCREAARRTQCENNLRNMGVALHQFHHDHGHFPAGREAINSMHHSWCSRLLPYLEEQATYDRIDFTKTSYAIENASVSGTNLPIFRCPSAAYVFDGKSDYGGMMGSGLTGLPWGMGRDQAFGSGVLVETSLQYPRPVRINDILDGTSNTIMVAEDVDRAAWDGGTWFSGFNCFSHDNGSINVEPAGEIYSWHAGGAFVLLGDGSVFFLHETADKEFVGALCTAKGGEVISLGH
jgi:hypothetical protein